MHNNPVLIHRYAKELDHLLSGSTLTSCVSSSPTSIFFGFNNDLVVQIDFLNQHTLFLSPDADHFPKRNVLHQFKACEGEDVNSVISNFPDRSFCIRFKNDLVIQVNAFGRHAGILCSKNNEIVDAFRYKTLPDEIKPPSELISATTREEFLANNRFVVEEMQIELDETGYFSGIPISDNETWQAYKGKLEKKPIYVDNTGEKPKLSLFPDSDEWQSYSKALEALHFFGKRLSGFVRYDSVVNEVSQELSRRVKRLEKAKSTAELGLGKISSADQLRQLGDLIMANLHVMESGKSEATLFNFYSNEDITVKLKKDLSPQKNAERYYKKSKKAHLELQHLRQQILSYGDELSHIQKQLGQITDGMSFKELSVIHKKWAIKSKSSDDQKSTPYKEFEFQGFPIWVGKSATGNDDLLKLAGKYDLWLHAREVAGSHVIIRNPENKNIPESLLETAASLAAGHSKNQHESLAAVVYTALKNVRKFKGAHTGQVKVVREKVVLVPPKKKV